MISCVKNGEWDIEKLQQIISQEMVEYIRDCIEPLIDNHNNQNDVPWWMGSTHGRFSVKIA